jgi:hypothetical protein
MEIMRSLMTGTRRFLIVDVRYGLGNRIRVLASAMGVAAAEGRPLMVVWVPDAHCNASLRALFREPFPFALLEEPMYLPPSPMGPGRPLEPADTFQIVNYMNEPGGEKNAFVRLDPSRHLYFRSAFLMSHPHGGWADETQLMLRLVMSSLVPVDAVASRVVTERWMVGVHVRTVLEVDTRAVRQYGVEATNEIARWRSGCRSCWPSNLCPHLARFFPVPTQCTTPHVQLQTLHP